MKRTGLQAVWLDHLKTEEERNKFREVLLANLNDTVFTKLRYILNNKLIALEDKEITEDSYTDKDWSHVMAHRNGQKSAYIEIIKLLTAAKE
jgi:hypothetical protein